MTGLLIGIVLGALMASMLHAYAVVRFYGDKSLWASFKCSLGMMFVAAPHMLAVQIWNSTVGRGDRA